MCVCEVEREIGRERGRERMDVNERKRKEWVKGETERGKKLMRER